MSDDKAEELARIAVELVTRVRDDEPEAVHRWLASKVDPADWMGMAIVLACAVPDDQPWTHLTRWTYVHELYRGPDTPEAIAYRRAVLDDALSGRPEVVPRLSPGSSANSLPLGASTSYGSAADADPQSPQGMAA